MAHPARESYAESSELFPCASGYETLPYIGRLTRARLARDAPEVRKPERCGIDRPAMTLEIRGKDRCFSSREP